MRREVCRLVAVSTLSLPLLLFAASPAVETAPAPAAVPGLISDALCGRQNSESPRAQALDRPDALPGVWSNTKKAALDRWSEAPPCRDAKSDEMERFEVRRAALEQLRDRLSRAILTEQIAAAIVRDGGRPPQAENWPGAAECPDCAALRNAAAGLAKAADRWPKIRAGEVRIGPWLAAAAEREPLIEELCDLQPRAGARAEIERSFRYYSWTAGAARLFEVAALFERLEELVGCQGR